MSRAQLLKRKARAIALDCAKAARVACASKSNSKAKAASFHAVQASDSACIVTP
jgi:hypothetical protein